MQRQRWVITSLERHFTLDRSMYGSDQSASLTPRAFKDLIGGVRKIEFAMKGPKSKKDTRYRNSGCKKVERLISNNNIMLTDLKSQIEHNRSTIRNLIEHKKIIAEIIKVLSACLKKEKNFICGNGGSAADAQHLSTEFLIRLRPNVNRKSFPVISLAQDVSIVTACGNDLGFENIFSRNLEGLGNKGDILFTLSTSENSKNVTKF